MYKGIIQSDPSIMMGKPGHRVVSRGVCPAWRQGGLPAKTETERRGSSGQDPRPDPKAAIKAEEQKRRTRVVEVLVALGAGIARNLVLVQENDKSAKRRLPAFAEIQPGSCHASQTQ